MKTNYFILNFINPSRLVYFANAPKSAKSADKTDAEKPKKVAKEKSKGPEKKDAPGTAAEAGEQTKEAGKQLTREQKIAHAKTRITGSADNLRAKQKELFKARKARLKEQKPYLEAVKRSQAGNMSDAALRVTGQPYTKALKKENKLKDEIAAMDKEYRELHKSFKALKAKSETVVASAETEKHEIVKIFEGKKDNLQKLLEYFTKEGYRKGKRDWVKYNTEVLNILDKKGANNKKEWIIAFQEWAGAGKDGAVGPNTMLALARKIGEEKIGRKIKRTMIAKRSKKKIPSKGFVVQKPITTEESGRSAGEVATGGVYYNPRTNEYASYINAEDVPRGWVRSTKDEVAIALGEEGEKKIKIASAETEQMSQMPEDWEREGIETDEGQAVASLDEKKKKEEDKG